MFYMSRHSAAKKDNRDSFKLTHPEEILLSNSSRTLIKRDTLVKTTSLQWEKCAVRKAFSTRLDFHVYGNPSKSQILLCLEEEAKC
ncbi:unnamed protein product [Allacma fusca]|uniref:Uncharacterized protein n=1 Tax=Allacma fusca TaxID=39272 RepID=A0A8J2KGL2_9HEXA|nr:unnamed protein product [Allacma fusca]